jgi:hypothetical protein
MKRSFGWIHCLILFFIFFNNRTSCAQDFTVKDSLKAHKVMLIPYDPRYYLSDADRDILEQSKIDPIKFRSDFRHNIDRTVQRAISGSYECISLLNDTADALESTMYKILGSTGYRYEKAIPITPKPIDDNRVIIKSKNDDPKNHIDSKTASQYIPVKKDALYMQAIVNKPEKLFEELYNQYQTDIFVFITQFDIKTNYSSCMDIANKIYRREVMVHFTVYNKQGNLLAGSYATAFFPSNSNEPNKIMGDCFPEIARYVAGCLP